MGKRTGRNLHVTMPADAKTEISFRPTLGNLYPRAPFKIEWLHTDQLVFDEKVLVNPRAPWDREPKLKKIGKVFDWNKFKIPTVVKRADDKYALLDGAGSWWLIKHILPQYKNFLIPCRVVEGLETHAEEADIFLAQKDNARLSTVNFFTAALVAKAPEAVNIAAALKQFGLSYQEPWPKGINSIPLLRVLERYGLLERTIAVARASWAKFKVKPIPLAALAIVLQTFSYLDERRLRKVIAEFDPELLQHDLKIRSGQQHLYFLAEPFAYKIVEKYNHGLVGSRRLDAARLHETATPFINAWRMTVTRTTTTNRLRD